MSFCPIVTGCFRTLFYSVPMTTTFVRQSVTNTKPSRLGGLSPISFRCAAPAAAISIRSSTSVGISRNTDDHTREDRDLIETLSHSETFRSYQRVFGDATCLPLALAPVYSLQLVHAGNSHQNQFCALVSRHSDSCVTCLRAQQKVRERANGVVNILRCPFGLYETALGIKMGDRTIGYLLTGQVLFKSPAAEQVHRAVLRLHESGWRVDAKVVEVAYQAIPVVKRLTYNAMVGLLEFFARQLSTQATQTVIYHRNSEPLQVARARQFIQDHYEERLSLAEVARHAHLSVFYFCKLFKRVTGANYTKYASKVRIEKARQLLVNPNNRVSEIAYRVGFQSLTHFNRVFKSITGESPTTYRKNFQPSTQMETSSDAVPPSV